MIAVGARAPLFRTRDHLERMIDLAHFAGARHVALLFYPLDFTPTCSDEVWTAEQLLPRFRAAHTQVMACSVNTVFSHMHWAADLGGISLPLLSDFHPKGAIAGSYGLYLEDRGIADRATVIIDAGGVVRHASSVTPSGRRDIGALASLCAQIDEAHGARLPEFPTPPGVPEDAVLYVRGGRGLSRPVLLAVENLHLQESLPVRDVNADAAAYEALQRQAGSDLTPCLVAGGEAMQDPSGIIRTLAGRASDVPL